MIEGGRKESSSEIGQAAKAVLSSMTTAYQSVAASDYFILSFVYLSDILCTLTRAYVSYEKSQSLKIGLTCIYSSSFPWPSRIF